MQHRELRLVEKVKQIRWILVLAICAIAGVGMLMLYSAAGGSLDPWAIKQLPRFVVALGMMLIVALSDVRLWLRWAYLIYFASLMLLVIVELFGYIGMGAQRWLDLGIINLQPSEVMKIALVLALARYFHGLGGDDVGRPAKILMPADMVLIPVGLVMKQPDLGTAMMLLLGGAAVFFAAGVRRWMFGVVIVAGLAAVPIAWEFLHDYQRRRVLTFLDPESDPLGAGYHVLQSKIALGSGGLFGKGFLQGTTLSSPCWPRSSV